MYSIINQYTNERGNIYFSEELAQQIADEYNATLLSAEWLAVDLG